MNQASEKLAAAGQLSLLKGYEELSEGEKQAFLKQIERLDINRLQQQQQLFNIKDSLRPKHYDPFTEFQKKGNPGAFSSGLKLIAEGKAGCLIIAGGQGTRLKIDTPKGFFPVSLITHKSLFQLFCEKIAAAGKRAGRPLSAAIMTSVLNHEQTTAFFAKNDYFGLNPSQISFFTQDSLPLLDDQGRLFLERKGHIAEGPDGNGSSLAKFYKCGIWDQWNASGIQYVNYILIDNPLADPFDAELIGHHWRMQADCAIKCASRSHPEEKVGVVVKEKGAVKVIEYSELEKEEKRARTSEGILKHPLANLSLFSFSMAFIKHVSSLSLPLHLARKESPYLKPDGEIGYPEQPNAWKCESFIFDLLPHAEKVCALLYPREECFAPLKNSSGEGALHEVQKALLARDRQILHELTGQPPPEDPIELSQEFYYPTDSLKARWKGVRLESGGWIQG